MDSEWHKIHYPSYYPPEHSYDDLKRFTDGLSEENFIVRTQFGKVYRGQIQEGSNGMEAQEVTVKIWVVPKIYHVLPDDNEVRLHDVIILLRGSRVLNIHPNLVKLIGFCLEGEHIGVVYDLKSLDALHNLIPKDTFTWLQRIKVALGLACLLEFLHAKNLKILVRNLAAAHIMLDQDYNPKLLDFDMISGGVCPDRTDRELVGLHGSYGYIDPFYATSGVWSTSCDVFAFGVILLGLIAKRVYEPGEESASDELFVHEWAENEYNSRSLFHKSKCSLVHKSLHADEGFFPSDSQKITKLAMQCVEYDAKKRPTMRQVVKYLVNLHVANHHAKTLGVDQLLRAHREALKILKRQ